MEKVFKFDCYMHTSFAITTVTSVSAPITTIAAMTLASLTISVTSGAAIFDIRLCKRLEA